MSFTEFVNDFRIGKACQSLRRGETVAEAAFTNGFNSISHFSVTFAKRMNMSPSAYRLKVSREEKESEDLVLC
ncbi:helix-turn-helix domain-containing protein [Arcticibacter sp. MXS-1]|uniref:helix-turn-helix domain-containing protein n=1 Tax=Arcticibacter sp. MXS-1 TaxID=3341726 RepID=UPI0035A82EA6